MQASLKELAASVATGSLMQQDASIKPCLWMGGHAVRVVGLTVSKSSVGDCGL